MDLTFDFDDQVRRGEIDISDVGTSSVESCRPEINQELSDQQSRTNKDDVGFVNSSRLLLNHRVIPAMARISAVKINEDDNDSSSEDDNPISSAQVFQALSFNCRKPSPAENKDASQYSEFNPPTCSDSGVSTLSTGSNYKENESATESKTDFASMFYYTTNRTRGRGRGRGTTLSGSSNFNVGAPNGVLKHTVMDSSKPMLDSDDSESEVESKITKVEKTRNCLEGANMSPSCTSDLSTVKLINEPDRATSYSCTTIPDFPGRVLTRGPLLMSPLGSINHFKFFKQMSKGINNLEIAELNSLQRSVIPHFLRGDECFILGGTGSGKSLSYLLPIVGRLLAQSGNENPFKAKESPKSEKLNGRGPSVIIVCSDSKSAMKIDTYLFSLVSASNQREVSYALFCEEKDMRKLRREIDILVTSVVFFSNILDKAPSCIGFEKLQYFVFDNVDVLLRTFHNEYSILQDALDNIMSKHSRYPLQRIFCGQEWCSEVEDLYMNLSSLLSDDKTTCVPTVFINSPNQSILYSEMKWNMFYCSEDDKLSQLLTLLRSLEVYKHKSTFIVCSTADIAIRVHQELENNDIESCLAETNNMTRANFNQIANEWDNFSSDRKLMVLNDEMIGGLHIYDVTCLIHYDMPMEKDTRMKSSTGIDRFSCMWSNLRDIAMEKVNPSFKYQRVELASYFLLTGKEKGLYKLKTFAMKMGCVVPDALCDIADEMRKEFIEKLPLCEGIERFGRCVETAGTECKNRRHVILRRELEAEPVVLRNGEIEVRIAECINPSTYTAQVMRCYDYKNGKRRLRSQWLQKLTTISNDLRKHFENTANRVPPATFQVGTLVAVENADGIFRARIMQIFTRTDFNNPKHLKVFCIDTGNYLQPLANQLYMVPTQLEVQPQLAVKLIVANLQPMDGASGYNTLALSKARELTLDKILNGRVQYAIGETVWVNPLVENPLDELNSGKTMLSVRLTLMQQKCAQNNESHMNNILELCRKTGYTCQELEDFQNNPTLDSQFMSEFFELGEEYHWAFLTTSTVNCPQTNEIWTSFTKNPHCIFGTLGKFDEELENLQGELHDEIEEMISGRCQLYDTQFRALYQEGLVVAVNDRESGTWHRGLIVHVDKLNADESLYNVFFVDMGDYQKDSTTKELFLMPRKFVTRLPFQAIAFNLCHIRPANDESTWDRNAVNKLMSITLDENEDAVLLDVVALGVIQQETLPCRCYKSIVLTAEGQDVGELLVQKDCAEFLDDGENVVATVKKNVLAQLNALFKRHRAEIDSDDDTESNDADEGVENDAFESEFDVVGFDNSNYYQELGFEIPSSTDQDLQTQKEKESPTSSTDGAATVTSSTEEPLDNQNAQKIGGFCDIKHPDVYWRQTRTTFILKVDHPDIKEYDVSIQKSLLRFQTINPPDYGFEIELFGTVESDPIVFCTGQYLRITANKRTKWKWPRPTKEDKRFRWLKEDIEDLEISDPEDEDANIYMLPVNANEFLEEEDESDSESDSDMEHFMEC